MKSKGKNVAELRADFMRRWFAIAISTGFATTVVKMTWVRDGKMPDIAESEQLARLFVALVATIFSWEGYLLSIQKKPLTDTCTDTIRYFLDVVLVFLYLFLLLTSKFSHFWIRLHAATFFIYMIWDFLTVCRYRGVFVIDGAWRPSIYEVYSGGLIGKQSIDRGPIITIYWFVYFFLQNFMPFNPGQISTFLQAFFILTGLIGFRIEKSICRENAILGPIAIIVLITIEFLITKLF